jgi:tetratricopeptide (TPR) repeat protein
VAPYALIVATIVVGFMIAWRKSPMAGFLGCWFFLILAPTSTVVPIAEQPMAESRMYLPLAAAVVLATLMGFALASRRVFVVLGIVAIGLGVLSVRRNHDYRSEVSIWEDTLAKHPNSSRGHSNLGMVFSKIPGQLPAAMAHYEEAMRIKSTYVDARNHLANALAAIPGRLPEAIAHYEEAVQLKPDLVEAHCSLAAAYAEAGRLEAAIEQLEIAARLNPTSPTIRDNLEKLKATRNQ